MLRNCAGTGEPPSEAHLAATEALSRVFSAHAPVLPAFEEEEEDGEEAEREAELLGKRASADDPWDDDDE